MRLVAGVALLVAAGTAPVAAQDTPQRVTWFLKGLHTGLCVDFLVSPTVAQAQFGRGGSPIPIESLATQLPALSRVASDEPAYRGWIPARYCWYLYREAVVLGRRVQLSGGRQPVGVGYLAIAGTGLPDSAEGMVVTLFTNSGSLAGSADNARLKVEEIDLTIGLIPTLEDSPTERRYLAKHGKTTIQWDGGPGDPRAPGPTEIRLAGATKGNSLRGIRSSFTPDSAFVASGNLRVTGGGPIPGMMSASPIRLVTSFFRGGDADWELGR